MGQGLNLGSPSTFKMMTVSGSSMKINDTEAGERAQWLKTLAAPPEA